MPLITKKKLLLFVLVVLQTIFLTQKIVAQTDFNPDVYKNLSQKRLTLPNQWSLTPAGDYSLQLGDLPLNAVWSSSKKYLAVTNNGVGKQFIQLFDASSEKLVLASEIAMAKAWYGLAFSKDEKYLYASGGNDNTIVIHKINSEKKLVRDTVIRLGAAWNKEKICAAGIALDDANDKLFTVTKEDSMLYVCSIKNKKIIEKIKLPTEPYAVLISEKRKEIYVSLWGNKKIRVFDLTTLKLKNDIAVGDHPNEMILDKNQKTLYVTNSLDNSVSIVDLKTKKTIETLNAALFPNAPNGSTTNSLALTDDEKKLYIANADNNCLAVFDVSQRGKSRSLGFIPTGWYPTNVRVLKNKIMVVNGKGFSSEANPKGPSPFSKREDNRAAAYIGSLFLGTMSVMGQPDIATLGAYSKLVYENTPYKKEKELNAEGEKNNPIPMRVGDTSSPIKYVFYIIKENRTYDQVLGDMKEGNGDSNICLFPEKVTPNLHALARNFVLLDNFYVDAEVSADGHNWSTAAYANDFVEKTWPTSYGGRGGNYDFEGTRAVAFPKNGFIWDYCKRAGISYRTYGEFSDVGKAEYKTLQKHFCTYYPGFDMKYQDIRREKDWERDFDSLLVVKQVPHFNTVRFSSDHTSALSRGAATPTAAVADNDQAVGKFVEHLSQSPIWAQSAVFILEDDAQNGSDHVDAHRSPAFVISPFIKRNFVDHTMYSTSSMMRTMELILGLPPMSQYDAAATPMWRCFTTEKNLAPYKSIEAQVNINEKNIADNELSRESESFNLAKVDAAPDRALNEVIWKSIKGLDSEMPAPKRAAFIATKIKKEED